MKRKIPVLTSTLIEVNSPREEGKEKRALAQCEDGGISLFDFLLIFGLLFALIFHCFFIDVVKSVHCGIIG